MPASSAAGGLWLGSWLRFILGNRLAPFVPTPLHVQQRMLSLAAVKSTDTVYDAGAGDGRLLLTAYRLHGARGVGFELDSRLAGQVRFAGRRLTPG